MSSIDNIVDKLIVKANKEKEEILKEANNEASQIREEALAKANYEKDRIWSDAKQEADKASTPNLFRKSTPSSEGIPLNSAYELR